MILMSTGDASPKSLILFSSVLTSISSGFLYEMKSIVGALKFFSFRDIRLERILAASLASNMLACGWKLILMSFSIWFVFNF